MISEEEEEWSFINYYFSKFTRIVGLIATLLLFAIVFSTHHFSPKNFVPDAKTMECELADYPERFKMQVLDHKKTFHREDRNQFKKFDLVEYIMDGVTPVDNVPEKKERMRPPKRTEVPVLISPGYGDSMESHMYLAKIVTDLTKHKDYRFRFYSIYFDRQAAHWSSTQYMYLREFSEYSRYFISRLYPKKRVIQICHSFGGDLCVRSATEQFVGRTTGTTSNTETSYLPDLFIRESVPHGLPGYYGSVIQTDLRMSVKEWVEYQRRLSVGMISFDAGYSDTTVDSSWLKGKNIDRIPIWTIDGVPDTGLTAQNMLICKPFLKQAANLLISYAEKQYNGTGYPVAKAFYRKWKRKMQESLPIGWKKDNHEGKFVVRSGETYEFVVNGTQWIEVSLQRSENIWLDIRSSCLTSATLIRQNKLIRRKEELIDSIRFEFGIFQAKQFEDIKLLLESNAECNVVIETPPSWVAYTQRFYYSVVTDPYYFWLGAQIMSTYLFMLESEKRSYRVEHQFCCYTLFIAAVLYHLIGTFGFNSFGAGVVLGAGYAMSIYYVFSIIDQYFFNMYLRRSMDSYTSVHYGNYYFGLTFMAAIASSLFAESVCACVILIIISLSSRSFLTIPLILTYLPNFYAAYDYVFTPGARNFGVGTAPFVFAFSVVGMIATVRKVANNLLPPPRTFPRNFAYLCFLVQLCSTQFLLETHYAIGFALLSYSLYARNYIPDALQDRHLDLDELEDEYEDIEEEDDDENEDD